MAVCGITEDGLLLHSLCFVQVLDLQQQQLLLLVELSSALQQQLGERVPLVLLLLLLQAVYSVLQQLLQTTAWQVTL
jgi:hypothetical protein